MKTSPSAISAKSRHTYPALACTSLAIISQQNEVFHGRTLELTEDLPSWLTWYPAGHEFQKQAPDGTPGARYVAKYPMMAITTAIYFDGGQQNMLEGFNEAGLSFSANMVPEARLTPLAAAQYPEAIPVTALGEWALCCFSDVEEVRQAVHTGCFWSPVLANLGGVVSPFHFAFYDKQGGSIVVEAAEGRFRVYDNPTRAMTNGPDFPWHLQNLNNYTHLTNIDCSEATLGNMRLRQPDSGIAISSLPSSDTSPDRFIRAVFYTSYAPACASATETLITLSHIMNRFDRMKNITVDTMGESGPTAVQTTEYTVWTSLSDLTRGEMLIRGYHDLGYQRFSLAQFAGGSEPVLIRITL